MLAQTRSHCHGGIVRVARLSIDRFRGVKFATLDFTGHTLFVGANNVGKSTVCKALDLVLCLDRSSCRVRHRRGG